MNTRKAMIEPKHDILSLRRQCGLLGLHRTNLYYKRTKPDDTWLANRIYELYIDSEGVYGYRKITDELHKVGIAVNHKKVYAMMRKLQIYGVMPSKQQRKTSMPNKLQSAYPYLLNNLSVNRPNQVWVSDITYIAMPQGFLYLVSIMDLYSRCILAYRLSNTLDASFCLDAISVALAHGLKPCIFNSDQGSQFTAHSFIGILKDHQIAISHDSTGRCFDNIYIERFWRTLKQENVYRKRYEDVRAAKQSLATYITWYNTRRVHQALAYERPKDVYEGKTKAPVLIFD